VTSEKSFQQYFLRNVAHGYRTELTTGAGFPDVLLIHGSRHSLVELKILKIGPSGNRKLSGLFKKSQLPFYMKYVHRGGERLFILFRLDNRHGLLHVDMNFLRDFETVTYTDLGKYCYKEYDNLKDLIKENFE
jgi:hypothetical protein